MTSEYDNNLETSNNLILIEFKAVVEKNITKYGIHLKTMNQPPIGLRQ